MIKIDKSIFKDIISIDQVNYYFSDVWIYNFEKIYVKGHYYLKVYLYNNNSDLKNIQSVAFSIIQKDKADLVECFNFQIIPDIADKRAFGAVIEISKKQFEDMLELKIINYHTTTENNLVEGPSGVLKISQSQQEKEKNDYLKNKIKNYNFFPDINTEYWQCICGGVNKLNSGRCYNCASNYLEVSEYYSEGLVKVFLKFYLKENPLNIDTTISIIENLEAYLSKLSYYNVSKDTLRDNLDLKAIYETYLKENKLEIDLSLTSEENINKYILELKALGLDTDKIDKSKFDYVEEKLLRLKNEKNTNRKNLLSFIFIIILLVSGFLIVPYAKYALAINAMNKGNFEVAEDKFVKLNDLLNSKEFAIESRYQNAIKKSEQDYLAARDVMIDLNDYKEARDYRYEYQYLAAKELSKTDLKEAHRLMYEIRSYKDAKDISFSYSYSYVNNLIEEENYDEALVYLNKLGFYKDSKSIREELLEKLGDQAVSKKDYDKAIDYFSKMIDKSKFKDVSYTFANKLYDEKNYKKARNTFYRIIDFKDSRSKIAKIENIIYKWEVKLAINNDDDFSAGHWDPVYLFSRRPIYFHVKVTNGRPAENIVLRYNITWPNGSKDDVETHALGVGGTYWSSFEWDNAHLVTKGKIVFKVYNNSTGELMGTITSFLK